MHCDDRRSSGNAPRVRHLLSSDLVEQMVIQNVFLAVRSHVHCLFGFSAYIGTNDHICNLATP